MASGTLVGGGGGGGGGDKHRWADSSKVYTRKSFNRSSSFKPSAAASSQQLPEAGAASDDSSSLNPRPLSGGRNGFYQTHGGRVKINVAARSKSEIRELRRRLAGELDQVRSAMKRLEARESQLVNSGYSRSQMSAIDGPKRAGGGASEAASATPIRRQLSVSVAENSSARDLVEKEKRTPKANQYYRNSDFVTGKGKLPTQESSKKLKTSGGKTSGGGSAAAAAAAVATRDKHTEQALKQCMNILMRLIKHRHGWVFGKPVDVKGLGLHDYYKIIKHPMDLGTVKTRLENNWYKSPREFAEDVRLTFHNAMTYNPKGQDVHVMAQQLLKIFEDKWVEIELEYNRNVGFELDNEVIPPAHPKKKANQVQAPLPEMGMVLDRSESTTVAADPKPQAVAFTSTGRVAAPKKPKAKDPFKRNMTYEEKQRLSSNLLNLPSEKLDNIVQIIKKRNSALSQHDDEIEVDIDSFDAETLWELDRFVTNYKKSLSKNKRKAELAIQSKGGAEQNDTQEANPVTASVDAPKETKTDERIAPSPTPGEVEKQGDNAKRMSSSSSSSSDSGSSSSDSDSESSSAGSDAGHSPRT